MKIHAGSKHAFFLTDQSLIFYYSPKSLLLQLQSQEPHLKFGSMTSSFKNQPKKVFHIKDI